MGQASESPSQGDTSPLHWDGKCHQCRKLMSRCVCFQESESDVAIVPSAASRVIADASETRPLWNALRKMHRKSSTSGLTLMQPSTNPSTKENTRIEALPPLSAHAYLHRHSDARPPRRGSRDPRREPSPERPSMSRKGKLHRGITTSSYNLRGGKDANTMRSVQATSSRDSHNSVRPKGTFSFEPEGGSDDENDDNVWEL